MKRLLAAAVAGVLSVPLLVAPPAAAAPDVSPNLTANGHFDPALGLSGTGWECEPGTEIVKRLSPGAEFVQWLPLGDEFVPPTVVAKPAPAQPTESPSATPVPSTPVPPTGLAHAEAGAASPTPRAVPATTPPEAKFVQSIRAEARRATVASPGPSPTVGAGPAPVPVSTDTVRLSPDSAMNSWPHHRPALPGWYELEGTPSKDGRLRAECSQVVPVRAGSTYTLTARVRGGMVFLGSDYGTTFTEPTRREVELTHTFVTGPTTDQVRVYLHGWYDGDSYRAQSVVLTGPPSDTRAPEAPRQVHIGRSTSSTAFLHWLPSPGATSYEVLHNGVSVGTTTDPYTTVSGLTAGLEQTLAVLARNPAGASEPTGTVLLSPPSSTPPSAPRIAVAGLRRFGLGLVLDLSSTGAVDGYLVYVDGEPVGWSYLSLCAISLTPGTHTVDVVAFNTAGESPRSSSTITMP